MSLTRAAITTLTLTIIAAGACTYGHEETQTSVFHPLVFPGEARLGSSAFMVIDSNQLQIGDHLERYNLHRERVGIVVEGNLGPAPATVRSVFALESGTATVDAEARRNAWVMVAFFDLPDEDDDAFSAPYPQHARIHLEIDGTPVPELEGVIWIVGEGGEPTAMNAIPVTPLLEDLLEPQTMVRLRARGEGGDGFQTTWTIGGISAEIAFDPDCLESPRAFAGSEATKAGVIVGPAVLSATHSGWDAVQIVLSHPQGFQLPVASSIDATRRGSGPILDIAFDRIQDLGCAGALDTYFEIASLRVLDRDGTLRVSRPAPRETDFDASQFFSAHLVDPDRP